MRLSRSVIPALSLHLSPVATKVSSLWLREACSTFLSARLLLLGLLPVVAARLVLTAWDAGVGGVAGAGGQDVEIVGARPRRDTVGVLAALAGRLLMYAGYQVSQRL